MIASLALALLVAPGAAQLAPQPSAPQAPSGGLQLVTQAPGVSASTMVSMQLPQAGSKGGMNGSGMAGLLFRISVPSNGTEELFTLFIPDSPPAAERPLLTCFHAFGQSHLDIVFNTDLLQEASRRNWYLLAPYQTSSVGESQNNYASPQSQENVQAALDFVIQQFDVDLDRVYGIGFSMGGGSALSYAARYQDRSRGAFAAVVNHTGSVALADVYDKAPRAIQDDMRLVFGGTPIQAAFEYQRSSLVEVDSVGTLITGGRHMGINLAGIPVRSYYNLNDPKQYLIDQTLAFSTFMNSVPGATHELVMVTSVTGCAHCWKTMNEREACNWLATHSLLAPPLQGEVLADRPGHWAWFDVDAVASDKFSSFAYDLDQALNRLTITDAINVGLIELEMGPTTLSVTAPIQWMTNAMDGLAREAHLTSFPQRPNAIVRNGVIVPEDCSPSVTNASWCFESGSQTLRLYEPEGAQSSWTILP